jgi:hypothetical protein
MMFELLLKVMERVCKIQTLNTPSPVANLLLSDTAFEISSLQSSNRCRTCTNHTVPYGTALWGGAVPGTSCQATIMLSLRETKSFSAPRRLRLRPLVNKLGGLLDRN